MPTKIEDTLKLFNRKERFWVVRTALGAASAELSDQFCAALGEQFGERLDPIAPASAWWAIDYHFDWLHAALRLHPTVGGEQKTFSRVQSESGKTWDVEGQQEDIDLVIAHGRDVILVEAKAFGAWSNSQLERKLDRLRTLPVCWNTGLVKAKELPEGERIRLHFVLMSPNRPAKIDTDLLRSWPQWGLHKGAPSWVPLDVERQHPSYFRVARCRAPGAAAGDLDHWTTVALRPNGEAKGEPRFAEASAPLPSLSPIDRTAR